MTDATQPDIVERLREAHRRGVFSPLCDEALCDGIVEIARLRAEVEQFQKSHTGLVGEVMSLRFDLARKDAVLRELISREAEFGSDVAMIAARAFDCAEVKQERKE